MSIKLVSWNVNGIRAVSKKDEFWDWFDNTDADIINFQEVRATQDKIPKKLADVDGYEQYFNEAEKKGYSGVGTYSKIEPVEVTKGLGVEDLDSEGRVLKIEYPDFILYNIYFPNSGMNAKRLDFKVDFCNALLKQLVELKNEGKNIVEIFNYLHTQIWSEDISENIREEILCSEKIESIKMHYKFETIDDEYDKYLRKYLKIIRRGGKKKIELIDKKNEVIEVFKSLDECAKYFNKDKSEIVDRLKYYNCKIGRYEIRYSLTR